MRMICFVISVKQYLIIKPWNKMICLCTVWNNIIMATKPWNENDFFNAQFEQYMAIKPWNETDLFNVHI